MATISLTVLTVQRDTFIIDALPTDTVSTPRSFTLLLLIYTHACAVFQVLDVKKKIEELSVNTPGRSHPVHRQKLLVRGRVLADDCCVSEWKDTVAVCMVCYVATGNEEDAETDVEEGQEVVDQEPQQQKKKKLQRIYKQLQCGLNAC